ncbi:MAG: ABC transporter permease [Planctomycetes bacterium]|nr:ABC transporter permease [Planctomycetota bacterium]
MRYLLPAASLARREVVRFLRQRNRVVSAVLQPVVFWGLFSAGLGGSLKVASGTTAAAFFFPGTLVLVLLFTAIFATISIIEDRREGFLQGVLVAPVPRGAIVLGKVGGATALAVLQGTLFLLLAPVAGLHLTVLSVAQTLGVLALVSFPLAGLGFSIAWRMDSTQGFHAVMMLFLMPMWILSGGLFPSEGVHPVLAWIVRVNPLTYGVAALRCVLSGAAPSGPSLAGSVAVTAAFGAAMLAAATAVASRKTRP